MRTSVVVGLLVSADASADQIAVEMAKRMEPVATPETKAYGCSVKCE